MFVQYVLFQFRNQTPTVTACVAHCVIVGSIFDANQQNKTRLVNMFYDRDVITIAKLKTWAPCGVASPWSFKRPATVSLDVSSESVKKIFLFVVAWKAIKPLPLSGAAVDFDLTTALLLLKCKSGHHIILQ